jgi:hypothetical protein
MPTSGEREIGCYLPFGNIGPRARGPIISNHFDAVT